MLLRTICLFDALMLETSASADAIIWDCPTNISTLSPTFKLDLSMSSVDKVNVDPLMSDTLNLALVL